jgi:type II secretory pathway pseudopilin PulG
MAFTLAEMLIVMGIIAILVALLIPATTTVRKTAKVAQEKAQLTNIEMALTAFRNDYGDYPPSHGNLIDGSGNPDYTHYCGAETLTEALFGWDLMGFHPNSAWRYDGLDQSGGNMTYDPQGTRLQPDGTLTTLYERKGSYLELATANVFRLGDLFPNISSTSFNPNNFVICDVFGTKSVTVGGKVVKAGNPILYYKANTSSKTIDHGNAPDPTTLIYNYYDNYYFINAIDGASPLITSSSFFYNYITNWQVPNPTGNVNWPQNPDSYLLISAGPDGLYGTKDDICNFDPNVPG